MHGKQNDKYTEMHGKQNDKYTEMHSQQDVKVWGRLNVAEIWGCVRILMEKCCVTSCLVIRLVGKCSPDSL